jgi:predicted Zn-dependent protease
MLFLECSPTPRSAARWLTLALIAAIVLPAAARAQQQQQAVANVKDEDVRRVFGLDSDYKGKALAKLKEAIQRFPNATQDQLELAKKEDDTLPPIKVMLAQLLFAAQRVDLARAQLEQAATDDESKDSPEVFLLLGDLALAEGRLTDAQLEYNAADAAVKNAKTDPNSDEFKKFTRRLYRGRTSVAENRQKWEQAKTYADLWLANCRGDGPDASKADKEEEAQALVRLARAQYFLDDKEAEANLEKASKLNSDLDAAKTTLGWLATQKAGVDSKNDRTSDKYKEAMKQAEKYFEDAIAAASGDDKKIQARAHDAYSRWLLNENKISDAQEHAERARELDPDSDAFKRVAAVLDLHRKNYKDAADIFRGLYQKSPSDFFSSNYLALALVGLADGSSDSAEKQNNLRMAEELAVVNAKANTKSVEALATLGWVYFNENRLADAEQILGTAIQNNQASPDTAYYLARLLASRGRLTEAKQVLEGAVNFAGPFTFRDEAEQWLDSLNGLGRTSGGSSKSSSTKTGSDDKGPSTPAPTPKPKAPANPAQPK